MVAVIFDEGSSRERMREVGRWWWVPLLTGILWLILAWVLLSFDATTVWTVAIFTGIFLIFGGATELMMATVTPAWRWLHIVLGVVFIAFGTASFVWPHITFVALAALISWVIMIAGVLHIVGALSSKDFDDLWWLGLVIGIAEIVIALWAISADNGTIVLLVVWLAAIAIARGLMNIVLAFQARKLRNL